MIPPPVVGEPFEHTAMDIVGPLPRTELVIFMSLLSVIILPGTQRQCCYATLMLNMWLRSCMVKLFSRVGIPREILTDKGTNFTSQLLAEVYQLLHIHALHKSPYHPQTDGLVERFNQTLKSKLRKHATKEGKDWDRLLPYVLFAYREVPQGSTGFSPFVLLYRRAVRGPLDILRETWEVSEKSSESVISHVLNTREKLEACTGKSGCGTGIGSNFTGISVTVTELIALQWITEGLLFDTEVVAGQDICNNFGHAPVGKLHNMLVDVHSMLCNLYIA